MTTGWTPDRVETLKSLWKDGQSASEISRVLHVSREAVIGKVHRLGLSGANRATPAAPSLRAPAVKRDRQPGAVNARMGRPKPGSQNPFGNSSPSEAAAKRAAQQAEGLAKIEAATEAANDDAIPLIGRPFGSCAWPVGTPERPAEQMCCGQRVDPTATATTASYCERHRARASSGVVPSPRDLERMTRRAA